MKTQTYYNNGDCEDFVRMNHRVNPIDPYPNRAYPYTLPCQPRNDALPQRATAHERPAEADGGGPQRRRIQVACSRCRRRKIRCSGDPGDGSGCSACRTAGSDPKSCTFVRVGSRPLDEVSMLQPSGLSIGIDASALTPNISSQYSLGAQFLQHRPSLPILRTRTVASTDDITSDVSPNNYGLISTHPSISRQYSLSSLYPGDTGFRPMTSSSVITTSTPSDAYFETCATFNSAHRYSSEALYDVEISTGGLTSSSSNGDALPDHGTLTSTPKIITAQERRLPMPSNTLNSFVDADVAVPSGQMWTPVEEPNYSLHSRALHEHDISWSCNDRPIAKCDTGNDAANGFSGLSTTITRNPSESLLLGYQYSVSTGSSEGSPISVDPVRSEGTSFTSSSTLSSSMAGLKHRNGNLASRMQPQRQAILDRANIVINSPKAGHSPKQNVVEEMGGTDNQRPSSRSARSNRSTSADNLHHCPYYDRQQVPTSQRVAAPISSRQH